MFEFRAASPCRLIGGFPGNGKNFDRLQKEGQPLALLAGKLRRFSVGTARSEARRIHTDGWPQYGPRRTTVTEATHGLALSLVELLDVVILNVSLIYMCRPCVHIYAMESLASPCGGRITAVLVATNIPI